MPDVWTKHPDIVRDLLKEGGFKCGVAPRVLKGRDPAWTCIIDGKRISGDIYIHHVDKLKSEIEIQDRQFASVTGMGEVGDWTLPAIALLVGIVVTRWLSTRRQK